MQDHLTIATAIPITPDRGNTGRTRLPSRTSHIQVGRGCSKQNIELAVVVLLVVVVIVVFGVIVIVLAALIMQIARAIRTVA